MTQARLEGGGHNPARLQGRNQPKSGASQSDLSLYICISRLQNTDREFLEHPMHTYKFLLVIPMLLASFSFELKASWVRTSYHFEEVGVCLYSGSWFCPSPHVDSCVGSDGYVRLTGTTFFQHFMNRRGVQKWEPSYRVANGRGIFFMNSWTRGGRGSGGPASHTRTFQDLVPLPRVLF